MDATSYFKYPAEYYRKIGWTYPDTLRLRGSVIPSVISDVVIITGVSVTVLLVERSHWIDHTLNVPNMIVPALSVVVGLILAFRTNTAYDRFWEGRKLWANLDVQIRNFSRMIWIGMKETVHSNPDGSVANSVRVYGHHLFGRSNSSLKSKASATSKINTSNGATNYGATSTSPTRSRNDNATLIDIDSEGHLDDDYEKILVIRLLLAFAVSVKRHLRQEFGVDKYYDLRGLLPQGYEPCAATDKVDIRVVHDRALGDPQRLYGESGEDWTIVAGNDDGQMSLPLEIAHGLTLWVVAQARAQKIESTMVGNLLSSVNSMTDIFTNMERIVFTPIPLAYSIHLRQVVYLYCLALPFTFIDALGWLTVPLMFLVSFTLFGIEAIGREIENPFGNDANDLHMDDFCRDLKRELDYTVNLKNTVPGVNITV